MKKLQKSSYWMLIVLTLTGAAALPHLQGKGGKIESSLCSPSAVPTNQVQAPESGRGNLRFHVLYTSSHLPETVSPVLGSAHSGLAIDRRTGRGEVYFTLLGAGILQLSGDLSSIRLLPTNDQMKALNLHNTTFWQDRDGNPFLTFPANAGARVFTTTLEGELVHTLEAPSPSDFLDHPAVESYFQSGGTFAPTDVAFTNGLFYITTGYSPLDYVLTARVVSTHPFQAVWNDLAFGGRGSGPGQLGTGHGLTVAAKDSRIEVADRFHSEIDHFTLLGEYLSTWSLPDGSWPCDIDYLDDLAVVPCLHGSAEDSGAPIYLLKNGQIVSTILIQDELGLEGFQHIHNAVLSRIRERYYIIALAWNPGNFVVLEQSP